MKTPHPPFVTKKKKKIMFGIKKKKELVVYSDENKLFDTLLYTSINFLLITLNVYSNSVPIYSPRQ